MDAMNAMNAMNGRAPDAYPPWRAAPDGHPPWRAAPDGHPPGRAAPDGSPPDPDDRLLAEIAETVRDVRTLDAMIAAADADLARLPTLLAWLVRVRHPVLWLICVPRRMALRPALLGASGMAMLGEAVR